MNRDHARPLAMNVSSTTLWWLGIVVILLELNEVSHDKRY